MFALVRVTVNAPLVPASLVRIRITRTGTRTGTVVNANAALHNFIINHRLTLTALSMCLLWQPGVVVGALVNEIALHQARLLIG